MEGFRGKNYDEHEQSKNKACDCGSDRDDFDFGDDSSYDIELFSVKE